MQRVAAVLFVILCCCCSTRRVATDAGAPSDLGLFSGDGPIILPDASAPDGLPMCDERRPRPRRIIDERGDLTLAVDHQLSVLRVQHKKGARAAQLIDHPEVAAFVLSRRLQTRDPARALTDIQRSLQREEDLYLSVRGSGAQGVSIDGYPDIKEALWEISSERPLQLRGLRNRLFSHIFDQDDPPLLPISRSASASRFFCRLSLVMRDTQAMVMGACAIAGEINWPLLDDLGNGTALAAHTPSVLSQCDRGTPKGYGVADILWIIDESESMDERREAIVGHASRFFQQATAAGLDFRMAVTGMRNPLKYGVVPGKLCSTVTDDLDHDGGADRFLKPTERDTFFSCIRNPPFRETHEEFGLTNAYEAVARMLPRRPNDPSRLRPDAKLVLIFATDEAAHEVKLGTKYKGAYGFLDENDVAAHHCALGKDDQLAMDHYLEPYVAYLRDQQAMVHLIGGTCDNSCGAEIPHGYRQLTEKLSGQLGDVCRIDLDASLRVIVNSIVAAASPYRLEHHPISSTLEVSANGWPLPRGTSRGFSYSAAANAISLLDVRLPRGAELVISYWGFNPGG